MQTSTTFGTRLVFFISLFLLSACTQKFEDSLSTVSASLDGLQDIDLNEKSLKNFSYDSAYVSLNDGRRVLMVLALVEENKQNSFQRLKWVSTDNYMLVTENGRIIKSVGFNHNLMGITPIKEDQILNTLPPPSTSTNKWEAYYDWMPSYRYSFNVIVDSQLRKKEIIKLASWSLDTHYVEEKINLTELHTNFINHYWLNQNEKVVKSIQYLGPNMDKVEMIFVKDFLPK